MNELQVLKIRPIFQQKIWGGQRLSSFFEELPTNENIGEAWAISAHPSGDCLIENGPLNGLRLSDVFLNHKDLFAFDKHTTFPLIVKLIDAQADLSIQVHPNDEMAHLYGQQNGKEEAWIILDAPSNHQIQLGHYATTKDQFTKLVHLGLWDKLLRYQKVEKNYFIPVRPGTLHAILKGTLLIEIQQSSDVTFRLYDYDRLDESGQKRDLHIAQSINVTSIPDTSIAPKKLPLSHSNKREVIFDGAYFSIEQWNVNHLMKIENKTYLLLTILEGAGMIEGRNCHKGDSFIITSMATNLELSGSMKCVVCYQSKGTK